MKSVKSAPNYLRTILLTLLAGAMAVGSLSYSPDAAAAVSCSRTVTANVVALDQSVMFNRLGAQNVNCMVKVQDIAKTYAWFGHPKSGEKL